MGDLVTVDDLKRAMPTRRGVITQEAVDIINASRNDPEFQGESLIQTASIYESVLKGVKASIPEYLNAIRFCAYISTTDKPNYTAAYIKIFGERDFVKERMNLHKEDPKYGELTSAASRYRRSKLVVDILTVSQVPLDMIFTGERFKAIKVLSEIMVDSRYDRDRINAAKELLAATKGAENVKVELDIGVKEDSAVQQLNDQLAQMAARQKAMLESGATKLEELGAMKPKSEEVVEGEYVHVSQ